MTGLFAGRYELVDPLGSGGAGVVWRAWDHRQHAYVAAKLLRKVDATSLVRFVREQSYRIEHPHVLTPLRWAAEDDQVLLALPLVRGGSLATLIGDYGPLPAPFVARILDQVLAALEVIHEAGLVHRDVKPANILLDATGTNEPRARLGDFGVAVAINEPRLTDHATVLGTPGYVAPEALQGDSDPRPTADLYAAGMLGLELLAGQLVSGGAPAHHARPAGDSAPVGDPAPAGDSAPAGDPAPAGDSAAAGDEADTAAAELRAFLTRLAASHPQDRPASAAVARVELAHLSASSAPLTGEIEVFDQLPEFPEGWGPAGPDEPAGPRGPHAPTQPHALAPTQPHALAPTQPGSHAPTQSLPHGPTDSQRHAPTQSLPHARIQPGSRLSTGLPKNADEGRPARRGLVVPVLAIVAGLALLATALILAL